MPPMVTLDSSKNQSCDTNNDKLASASVASNWALGDGGMEQEVLDADILLPSVLPFKRVQTSVKYPEDPDQSDEKHWKGLKQMIQAENYDSYPAGEPSYLNIQSPPSVKTSGDGGMEQQMLDADILSLSVLPFKRVQTSVKSPDHHSNKKQWKGLNQMIQAESYDSYPAGEPNYLNIESTPSVYPAKTYCDITGFPTSYKDPRTNLRYANAEMFKRVRSLSDKEVQAYLALRKADVVLLK